MLELPCIADRSAQPSMAPYGHHIILCQGQFCDPEGRAQRLYSQLAQQLQARGLLFSSDRVKRGLIPCLGVCSGGPLLVVYPEGRWYAQVDEALLDAILDAIAAGEPLPSERCFHQL